MTATPSTPRPTRFLDLNVGETFEFSSDPKPGYGMMPGPWCKIGIRRYCLVSAPSFICEVGTIKVQVIRTNNSN